MIRQHSAGTRRVYKPRKCRQAVTSDMNQRIELQLNRARRRLAVCALTAPKPPWCGGGRGFESHRGLQRSCESARPVVSIDAVDPFSAEEGLKSVRGPLSSDLDAVTPLSAAAARQTA